MGVDILGPFPRAGGGYRFLFVAINKFTKWPEATPVVNITQGAAVAFLKSIVYRFRVPSRIITDNGTQFTSQIFQEYCEDIGTQLCFASVAHPRSNGQVEMANAEILRGLKTHTDSLTRSHAHLDSDSQAQYNTQWSRVLRFGGLNHSKPLCVLVFIVHLADRQNA
jgi:transposase InsO family protein